MDFKPIALILVIIFFVGKLSIPMEPGLVSVRVPFAVTNHSPEVVTVVFPEGDGIAYYNEVGTNETKNASDSVSNPVFFMIGRFGGARVNTTKGLFIVRMQEDNTIVLEKCGGDNVHPYQSLQQFSNVFCILKAFVTVNDHGMPHLSIIADKPKDGRPDVPLSVYGALVGNESYATPKQILDIKKQGDAETVYADKILQWHPKINESPEATAAFALIKWAAKQLGIK